MNIKQIVKPLLIALILHAPLLCFSFDPLTHLWIGQQILNDIVPDGKLTIDNKEYEVHKFIVKALRDHPKQFMMGCLGPDIFPDPVVGQMTTHPGLEHGWQTDEWIWRVIQKSGYENYTEIAFAFGFACHAAGDVFAHSYINAYSGDVFLLNDGEREVEVRHFTLEKYIGTKLPPFKDFAGNPLPNPSELIAAPNEFISRVLILDASVRAQYSNPEALAFHLAAMSGIKSTVAESKRGVENVMKSLFDVGTEFYKKLDVLKLKKIDQDIKVIQAKIVFDAADLVFSEKKNALNLVNEALKLQEKAIIESTELILLNEKIFEEQSRAIEDCIVLSQKLNNELNNAQKEINETIKKIQDFPPDQINVFVKKVCNWIEDIFILREVCEEIYKVNEVFQSLLDNRTRLQNKIADLQNKETNNLLNKINSINAKARAEMDKLSNKAKLEAAEASKKLSEQEYKVVKEAFDSSEKIYNKAKEEYDNAIAIQNQIINEIDNIIPKTLELIRKFESDLNPLVVILSNWESDIIKATNAYISAGETFAKDIAIGKSDGINHYLEWYKCWAPVYGGTPKEIPNTTCAAMNYYKEINDKANKILEEMGDFAWLIAPQKMLSKEIFDILKPEIEQVAEKISAKTFDKNFPTMIKLLSGRIAVTPNFLNETFLSDDSDKNLLCFNDFSSIVDQDLHLDEKGHLNPDEFNALHNAIVLSKLCLLTPKNLNKVFRNYSKVNSTIYGENLYSNDDSYKFSILIDAVRSIDGSNQWQYLSMPYPRRGTMDPDWPEKRKFGYNFNKSSRNGGFRFWTDPVAREEVFKKIFKGPINPGLFGSNIPDLSIYPFKPCVKNPFPKTQDDDGNILSLDPGCKN